MPTYCVNRQAQPNGDHEVHDLSLNKWCLPVLSNRIDLGWHATCREAVAEAKRRGYSRANGCKWCAPECHTS